MTWENERARHGLSSQAVSTEKSFAIPSPMDVSSFNADDTPNKGNLLNSAFSSDPKLMVKLSGMMEYLLSDEKLGNEQKLGEINAYQFAYDYVRGSTKHYSKSERETFFGNKTMLYYFNMAYLENITPDAFDDRKRNHYERNYKRGLKELQRRAVKKEKAIQKIADKNAFEEINLQHKIPWYEKLLFGFGFKPYSKRTGELRDDTPKVITNTNQ